MVRDESMNPRLLVVGDSLELLKGFPPEHFSACITDPPYNYEFIGHKWSDAEIDRRIDRVKDSNTLVKNIPYGSGLAGGVRNSRWYQRVNENIADYRKWCFEWSSSLYEKMKPGAFVLVFNSTRTVAHIQVALEQAGFYARDILVYRRHSGIPKGLNAAKKLQSQGDEDWQQWQGWHSALRNEWEAICVVQKPLIGNYVKTIKSSGVGLFRAESEAGFQSNILEGFRFGSLDKTDEHVTVKPVSLMSHLVSLTVPTEANHIVIDPFMGTGTTCLAAEMLDIDYVGIDINPKWVKLAEQRIADVRSSIDGGATTFSTQNQT